MNKTSNAMHVATTTSRRKDQVYKCHLVRQTYRENGKVKHRTLANLSHLPPEAIEAVRRVLQGDPLVSPKEAFEIRRSLPHGHVAAVVGLIRKLGLDRLIASRPSPLRERVLALIAARVLDPSSKLATARALQSETALNTLGISLGLDEVDEDDLYEAMDWLLTRQGAIEKALAKQHLREGALVLYDLTSTYFEGEKCPPARRGYSRDGKPGTLQIEFGLLCNADGCPVAVEVFEGNLADPKTLEAQVRKLRDEFGLSRIVLVGDRGMLTETRLDEDLRPQEGWDWISCLRAPAVRSLVEEGALQLSLFDEWGLGEITSPEYPGERLIVCRNPLLAKERRRKREELLAATESALEKIVEATRRAKRPLTSKEQIALRAAKTANRFKVGKHFRLDIQEGHFAYAREEEKIAEEAALDGFYVIRTSVPAVELGAEQVVTAYKGLSKAERAFRCLKGVDLKVRPIHHRLEDRVRAHVFLCMPAYYVEWHLRQALAPLLFQDEDPWGAQLRRENVVAPAKRSESAEAKTHTKRTSDGLPLQSYQSLLAHLGTLTKNWCFQKTLGPEHPFEMLAQPTPVQQRAFDLLGVSPLL